MQKLLKQTLSIQARNMAGNAAKVLRSADPECLHDLRVATLRSKFALKLLRANAGVDARKKTHDRIKHFQALMGEARNLDVLSQRLGGKLSKDLQSKVRSARMKARSHLVQQLKSPAFTNLMDELTALAAIRSKIPPTVKVEKFTLRIIENARKQVIERKKRARSSQDLHEVRIAFKKLRYACEFFGDFYKGMDKAIKLITGFQDILGDRQDAIAAIQELKRLGGDTKEIQALVRAQQRIADAKQKDFERKWREKPLACIKV